MKRNYTNKTITPIENRKRRIERRLDIYFVGKKRYLKQVIWEDGN